MAPELSFQPHELNTPLQSVRARLRGQRDFLRPLSAGKRPRGSPNSREQGRPNRIGQCRRDRRFQRPESASSLEISRSGRAKRRFPAGICRSEPAAAGADDHPARPNAGLADDTDFDQRPANRFDRGLSDRRRHGDHRRNRVRSNELPASLARKRFRTHLVSHADRCARSRCREFPDHRWRREGHESRFDDCSAGKSAPAALGADH